MIEIRNTKIYRGPNLWARVPGDRRDEAVRAFGHLAGQIFDESVVREDESTRGRPRGQIAGLFLGPVRPFRLRRSGGTMKRIALFVAVAMTSIAIFPVGVAVAQGGTPASGGQSSASCADVTPRDAQYFQSLATPAAATPPSNQPTTGATPTPFAMPEGQPADDATVAEVTALYEQLVDCLNQGDYLRAYALYSDDYLLRNLSQDQIASMAATPVPVQESQRVSFGGILDARRLEDGRVGALITTHSEQAGDLVLFTIVRREGDQLLIDDEQVVETEMQLATPAA